MVVNIDPILGVPDTSFDSNIDQIPLDSQVVDWHGLDASAQPVRAPVYPDDVFAIFADLQAWVRSNPKQINKLYCDDQNRLLVNTDGTASGGGNGLGTFIATETNQVGGSIVLGGTVFHSGTFGYSSADPIRLLSIEVNPNPGGSAPGTYCEWSFGIDKNGVNPSYLLYSGNFYKTEWTQAILPRTQWVMPYAPIDYVSMGIPAGQGTFWFYTSSGDINVTMAYALGH